MHKCMKKMCSVFVVPIVEFTIIHLHVHVYNVHVTQCHVVVEMYSYPSVCIFSLPSVPISSLPISHPHRVTQLGSSPPSASHMEAVMQDRRVATDVYLHHYCHKPVAGSELLHTHTQCLYRRTRRLANQVHVYTMYIHVHVLYLH